MAPQAGKAASAAVKKKTASNKPLPPQRVVASRTGRSNQKLKGLPGIVKATGLDKKEKRQKAASDAALKLVITMDDTGKAQDVAAPKKSHKAAKKPAPVVASPLSVHLCVGKMYGADVHQNTDRIVWRTVATEMKHRGVSGHVMAKRLYFRHNPVLTDEVEVPWEASNPPNCRFLDQKRLIELYLLSNSQVEGGADKWGFKEWEVKINEARLRQVWF